MKVRTLIQEWLMTLPELFFPRICAVCGKSLFFHETVICTPCNLHLPKTGYHTTPDNTVARMFWGRVRLVHCSSFLHYRKGNSVRKLIHQLKYKGRQDVGVYLGAWYGRQLAASGILADMDAIVPVPLHRKKERARGYNQARCIADGISQATGIPVWTAKVFRKKYNVSQTTKDRYGRWENAMDRFALCEGHNLGGKHLLIVDDVITTGSTIEALAEAFSPVEGIRLSVVSIGSAV